MKAPAVIEDVENEDDTPREVFVEQCSDGSWWWSVSDSSQGGSAPTRDEALYYAGWWMGCSDEAQVAKAKAGGGAA